MGSGLTIITPGGLAMASEEVFALVNQCETTAAAVDSTAWRLRMISPSIPGLAGAATATAQVGERIIFLEKQLRELAKRAAEQEAWRATNLQKKADGTIYALVAGMVWSSGGRGEAWAASMRGDDASSSYPASSLRGNEPAAVTDDTAAILRGRGGGASGVSLSAVESSSGVTPATSMAERVARIPDSDTPIRVETYQLPDGTTHAEVFIAGTNQWSVGTGDSPFDMESNLGLVAGVSAASALATTQAMRMAGVKPGDAVGFVGHSQGGAVAATLAESGVYRTTSLVTVGAPTSTLPVKGDYPAVLIEHANDIVPGVGGSRVTTNATVVRRDSGHQRFDVLGAHSTDSYRETAAMIDLSSTPELAHGGGGPTHSQPGRVSVFSASRLPGQPPPG